MTVLRKGNERYTGPVCYIDRDWVEVRRSRWPWGKPRVVRTLIGGWHYGTTVTKRHGEMPDPRLRLHLNDTDPGDPFYELARDGHQSWLEKHGPGNIVHLEPRGE